MGEHSIIPPSSAHIWGAPNGCPGWVTMSQMYPETEESEEAKGGTAAHELAAAMVKQAARTGSPDGVAPGETASNGVVFTEAMWEGAELYAEDVGRVMRETGVFTPYVEHAIRCPRVHELSHGTPDCFIHAQQAKRLVIWDYKFGFDRVEVFGNWQLVNYAAGVIELLGVDGHEQLTTTVEFRVVQPRAYHPDGPVRSWSTNAADLRAYINILHNNAHKALSGDAECKSGPHCKNCSARHACNAALVGGWRLYEAAAAPVPMDLSNAALGLQLQLVGRARKHLEALEVGYKAEVEARVRSGQSVPFWRTQPAAGRLSWNRPVEEVVALGQMFGKDLAKPGAVTPNQAIKLGIDEAVIMGYASREPKGYTVVADTGDKARQVFN